MNKNKRNALLFGSVFMVGTAAVAADHVAHRGLSGAKPATGPLVAGSATCAAIAPCAAAAPCAAGAASPCAAGASPVAAPLPAKATTATAAPPPRIAGHNQGGGPRIATTSGASGPKGRGTADRASPVRRRANNRQGTPFQRRPVVLWSADIPAAGDCARTPGTGCSQTSGKTSGVPLTMANGGLRRIVRACLQSRKTLMVDHEA